MAAFTEATHVDPAEFAVHLDKIRTTGIAVSRDDYLGGAFAVAAPILGRDGALAATVSLGGRSEDFNGVEGDARAAAVAEAARRLRTTVGARPA